MATQTGRIKLTSYDGSAVTYDEIGNATNIGDKHYTWTNGRQLAEYEDEDFRVEYTYNADGLRTMKKIYGKDTDSQTGEVTEHLWRHFDYVWKDGVLDSAKVITYDEQTHEVASETAAKYLYDAEKTPVGMIFTDPNDNTNDLKAWYIKDLQGDVTGVYIEGIGVSVRYAYDAFGKIEVLPGTIAGLDGAIYMIVTLLVNPFTYRGYSFDVESNTYYLQSRYYDPQIGRFLNADDSDYIPTLSRVLGTNLFNYTINNPVMNTDYSGHFDAVAWKAMSDENYKVNQRYEKEIDKGYINDQNKSVFTKMYYGIKHLDFNGCELIAIYNTFLALGKPKKLADIVRAFELNNGAWMSGFLGTKPQAIGEYLSRNHIKYDRFYLTKSMDKVVKKNRIFIVVYAYSVYIHTVMAIGQDGGNVRVYNDSKATYKSINALVSEEGYKMIIGYYVYK